MEAQPTDATPPDLPEPAQIGSLRRALGAFQGSSGGTCPRALMVSERLERRREQEQEQAVRERSREQAIAALLADNPDLRVLRRLAPLTGQPAAAGTAVARVAIVDCETTGFDLDEDPLIELGVVVLEVAADTGRFIRMASTFSGLEDPGRPLPEHIREITGLTDEMLRRQRIDERALANAVRGVRLVIAHNAEFDRQRVEKRIPWLSSLPWACSQREFNWQAEGMGSSKLEFLCFKLGYFHDAHRALPDAHALARVIVEARARGSSRSVLECLIASSQEDNYRVYATAAPFEAKDALKARGYRWNAQDKVWSLEVPDLARLDHELKWLQVKVYEEHRQNAVDADDRRRSETLDATARVRLETLDACVRYTTRPGRIEWKALA